jgi:hypothetical protein
MESFRHFTYWFMGINLAATTLFTLVAVILGGIDLRDLLRDLKCSVVDDTDDGRATSHGGEAHG